MKPQRVALALLLSAILIPSASAQVTNWLPGRALTKLVPDYLRPRMYALNQASGTNSGTILALDGSTGATLNEIVVGIRPTDMVMTPSGYALYVINGVSRTISKINLDTFTVASEKAISTPNSYDLNNALHLVVGRSNLVYFTDGAWAPSVTTFDYQAGTNIAVFDDGNGVGG